MIQKQSLINRKDLILLISIWLYGFLGDRLWFWLDHELPTGEQAFYLNSLMDYWQWLKSPHLLDQNWWNQMWLLSFQVPPLLYLSTLPLFQLFGDSVDVATLILSVYSAILLASVYGLGTILFNRKIAIGTAFLCQVIPILYHYRLTYSNLYPSTALITASLFSLTLFYWQTNQQLNLDHSPHQNYLLSQIFSLKTSLKNYNNFLQEQCQKSESTNTRLLKYSFDNLLYFSQQETSQVTSKSNLQLIFQELKLFVLNSIKDRHFKYALLFGLFLSISLLMNSNSLNFLLIPILFIVGKFLLKIRQAYSYLFQFIIALSLSFLIFIPWYKHHWITLLFFTKTTDINHFIPDSSLDFNFFTNWLYYLQYFPILSSWFIFLLALVIPIYLLLTKKYNFNLKSLKNLVNHNKNQWLIIVILGSYLLWSFQDYQSIINIVPLIPVFSLIIVAIIEAYQGKFTQILQRGIIIISSLLMILNLFPLPGQIIAKIVSPHFQYYPEPENFWHYQEVLETIINQSPYLSNNVGFINQTDKINPDALSFYGRQNNLKVLAYSLQSWYNDLEPEKQSIDWILAKTGSESNLTNQTKLLLQQLEQNPQFNLEQQWLLPDHNFLKLYHRSQPIIEVQRISKNRTQVQLDYINLPEKAPPGFPIPVTYEWSGKWQDLEDGIILLTWLNTTEKVNSPLIPLAEKNWLHDHSPALGKLNSAQLFPEQKQESYRIIEHTAMLPSPGIALGNYQLYGLYWNQKTGKSYPLSMPKNQIQIDLTSDILNSIEPDFITQLRIKGISLSKGTKDLDSLLKTIMRIHQFDPMMKDVKQLENTLNYRLNYVNNLQNQSLIDPEQSQQWLYSLALTQILQRDLKGTINSLQKIIALEPKNPYSHVYLASIYLYNWQTNKAYQALKPALEINRNLPEVKMINGMIALMQGRLFTAWQELNSLNFNSIEGESL